MANDGSHDIGMSRIHAVVDRSCRQVPHPFNLNYPDCRCKSSEPGLNGIRKKIDGCASRAKRETIGW